MSTDVETFKAGMRRLAGHVCVITTTDSLGARSGLTATAVCSVSAAPPTLLCCINRQNTSYKTIRDAGILAVNVLAMSDRELANRFATGPGGETRFAMGLWRTLETGAPILESALASFDCRIAQAVDVGTHGILFGEIVAIRVRETDAKPLLYAHGQYGGFMSFDSTRGAEALWIPSWEGTAPDFLD